MTNASTVQNVLFFLVAIFSFVTVWIAIRDVWFSGFFLSKPSHTVWGDSWANIKEKNEWKLVESASEYAGLIEAGKIAPNHTEPMPMPSWTELYAKAFADMGVSAAQAGEAFEDLNKELNEMNKLLHTAPNGTQTFEVDGPPEALMTGLHSNPVPVVVKEKKTKKQKPEPEPKIIKPTQRRVVLPDE